MLLAQLFSNLCYRVPEGFGDMNVDRISYDSRVAAEGTLFVCINGSIADGHKYAIDAYNRGCRAFLCEHPVEELPADAAVILADNTSLALPLVSAEFYSRPADRLRIIGVTGTKGKTTTALLIHNILNDAGIKTGYIGSAGIIFDGHRTSSLRTTPESTDLHAYFAKMCSANVTTVVMEVSSQAIFRDRVYGIKFDTCVYTNLSPDHIGPYEHPDFDHYRASKARLFSEYGCDYIVYNKDDDNAEFMLKGATALASSVSMKDPAANYYGHSPEKWRSDGALGIDFCCKAQDREHSVRLRSPGAFSVYNALLAIAVCRHLHVSFESIISSLSKYSPIGRFEVVDALPYATFIVDFAHNELSLRSALSVLREYDPKRLIVLVGSVGGRTYTRRAPIGSAVSDLADLCILTADDPDFEDPNEIIKDILLGFGDKSTPYVAIPDRREAIYYAVSHAEPGDIILLAGKGHEDFQLLYGEHTPFSERSIIKEAAVKLFTPMPL